MGLVLRQRGGARGKKVAVQVGALHAGFGARRYGARVVGAQPSWFAVKRLARCHNAMVRAQWPPRRTSATP
jgi:uncharacterized protein YcfJ